MENQKGAFRHLWAAIQFFRRSEKLLPKPEVSDMVPIYDAMLRLDFLAQKLVPYARSSFLRCSDQAFMERPFWNRPSLECAGISQSDRIAAERSRLIQLICAHNKLSRVIWGCWCPTSERPSREELMGFYSEMLLWKENSPATFASCPGLDTVEALDLTTIDSFPIPPPACHFLSNEAALNIATYNAYLGCAVAMITTTDQDPVTRELEAFKLVYQNLCIVAGLIESHDEGSGSPYKSCDAVSMGISLLLYHGTRRCFSLAWQEWTITALRSIGREGLCNGFTLANTLETLCQLEAEMRYHNLKQLRNAGVESELGPIRDRLIPLLMPQGDSDEFVAFYLRYGHTEADRDERAIQVVTRATWEEDMTGTRSSLKLDVYESAIAGDSYLPHRPQDLDLYCPWRQAVEKGWHGYLTAEAQEVFLKQETLPPS